MLTALIDIVNYIALEEETAVWQRNVGLKQVSTLMSLLFRMRLEKEK